MPILDYPRRTDQSVSLSQLNFSLDQLGTDDASIASFVAAVLIVTQTVSVAERRIPSEDAALERARTIMKLAYSYVR